MDDIRTGRPSGHGGGKSGALDEAALPGVSVCCLYPDPLPVLKPYFSIGRFPAKLETNEPERCRLNGGNWR